MSTVAHLKSQDPVARGSSALALGLAGVAALLASACCVLPLLLAVLGISGAWISQMRWLQPYSTGLMALACAALGLAAWRLFRSAPEAERVCNAGDEACRKVNATARRWFWLVAMLTLIPMLVPLAAPMFY
jgi:mercuric ion transport protein